MMTHFLPEGAEPALIFVKLQQPTEAECAAKRAETLPDHFELRTRRPRPINQPNHPGGNHLHC